MYNEGISHTNLLIDLGSDLDIVQKSGAWYSYGDLRLGQGKENARQFLLENPDVLEEVDGKLRAALDLPGGVTASAAGEGADAGDEEGSRDEDGSGDA